MTNAEKYLKDGVEYKELSEEIAEFITIKDKSHCAADFNMLVLALDLFFEEETKPTLTEDEKIILRNIECFKESYSTMDKIHRTKDGDLYITKFWIDFGEEVRLPYKHLFQFIKERRRI